MLSLAQQVVFWLLVQDLFFRASVGVLRKSKPINVRFRYWRKKRNTLPETNSSSWKLVVGRLLSFCGAMLVLGRVTYPLTRHSWVDCSPFSRWDMHVLCCALKAEGFLCENWHPAPFSQGRISHSFLSSWRGLDLQTCNNWPCFHLYS